MLRLVIVDSQAIVREGIRALTSSEPDLELVDETECPRKALNLAQQYRPDVFVTDVITNGQDRFFVVDKLRSLYPDIPILILSRFSDSHYLKQGLRRGASGFITKSCQIKELLEAIRKVAAGQVYIGAELAENVARRVFFRSGEDPPHAALTEREFEVFIALIEGRTVTAIADELGISSKTVSTHKGRILDKLAAETFPDLVRYAIDHELI